MLLKFLRDQAGAAALTFGLLSFPMAMVAGFAVDYARIELARSSLQDLADHAVLFGAKSYVTSSFTDGQAAQKAATDYVGAADFSKHGAARQALTVSIPTTDTLRVAIRGRVATVLMNLTGTAYVDVDVSADATRAVNGTLEMVMVLDTTGSMSGTKLTTLKTAAKSLITTLQQNTGADIKYGLAPFANYVNVGMSRRNESWITVPADSSTTTYSCQNVTDTSSKLCTVTKKTCYNDGAPYACNSYSGCPVTNVCQNRTSTSKWSGCVGSRAYPYNTNVESLATIKIPGLLNITCSAEITPLTTAGNTVKTAIDAMTASGETYLPAGLLWGFNMLTPGGPASSTAGDWDALNRKPRKVMVLMTDGQNTKSLNGTYHNGSNVTQANQYTTETCNAIKAKKIEIFTIAFTVTDQTVKTILSNCASDTAHYYDATDTSALASAFDGIGNSLKLIRLVK